VKKFGLMFALVSAVIGGALAYAGSPGWLWVVATMLFFLLTGLFAQPVLRPVYRVWMAFARVLAWVNTRVLLGVFFYLALTPMGVLLRLMGKDLLDERIDRKSATYWVKRPPAPFDSKRYERLF
jgi:hypothetical protein